MATLNSSLFVLNKRKQLPKREHNMDNPVKLAKQRTQNQENQKKNNTICVGHHYAQTKTDNVNKTQTTGGKDKPNIFFFGHRNGHHDTELTKG